MSRFVRQSSYRHVYGVPVKREKAYDNIRTSASAWDTNLVAVNPLFLAVNYQSAGGGAFLVTPLSKTGKLPDIYPLCRAHTAPVLDTAWSPFDDHLIASVGEDCKVALTRIDPSVLDLAWNPPSGSDPSDTVRDLDPLSKLPGHQRKVGHVSWHPTAKGVLASAAVEVKLWDVEKGSEAVSLASHPDMVQSLTWDWSGSLVATTCKDKKVRLFDPRSGTEPVIQAESHAGIKGSRICWMGSLDRICTTGFSKMSDRQIFLWDSRAMEKGAIKQVAVDTSSGTLMPFWAEGNNILFLAGKGDGNIRYYEYENDDLFYLSEHKSTEPQRGMTFLPRRGLNISECEIARAYKCQGSLVEPISFIVPRKSDAFQADLYPPAPSSNHALTADEFFGGKTSGPILIDLSSGAQSQASYTPTPLSPPTAVHQPSTPSPQPSISKPEPTKTFTAPPPEPQKERSTKMEVDEPESYTARGGAGDSNRIEELEGENEKLRNELRERDELIRGLELQLEQMRANQRKAAETLLSM